MKITAVELFLKMSDWQPVWDANSKKYYYWNKNTQETSWINKTGLARCTFKQPFQPIAMVTIPVSFKTPNT